MNKTLKTAAVDDVVDDLMTDPNRARDIIHKLHNRLLGDVANDTRPTSVEEDRIKTSSDNNGWHFREVEEVDDDLFDNMPV